MNVGIVEILAGGAVFLLFLHYYFTKKFDYWTKRNIPGPKPIPLFGNFKDVMLGRVHVADHIKKLYDAYPQEPVIGVFSMRSPALIAKDPEIIKDVMIKNFQIFADRGTKIHEDIDPLAQHLVFLDPKRWKPLRRVLTPVFSSGKLKEMFYLINECAEHFEECLGKMAAKDMPVECRELTAKFTTDVIGVCAFGLNMNAMAEEDSQFRKIGRGLFKDTWQNRARRGIRSLPHWMSLMFKPIARNDKVVDFFVNTLKDTMEHRKKNNVRRNDFVDLLMDIKENPEKLGGLELTDMLLTAQAFVFFVAGFETSSTTISHAMYCLALNQDIQNKLRKEVNDVLEKSNGKFSYDNIKEMTYLDKVFKETLRMYPPAVMVARKAMADHTFENFKLSVPKGMKILIPIYSIHYDPTIYPEPDKFDPERFDKDAMSSRRAMSFLPFGDGPRNCIGERFAQLQSKIGLAIAVKNYKFDICDKTCIPYVKNVNAPLLAPKGDLYLKIRKI